MTYWPTATHDRSAVQEMIGSPEYWANSPESPGPVIDVGIQPVPFQVIVPVEGGKPGELLYGRAATHRLADAHDRSMIPAEPVLPHQMVPFHNTVPRGLLIEGEAFRR